MKKNTVKMIGISMSALLLVTGCGKIPKLENGQDAVVTLKGEDISVDTLYDEVKERYALSALIDLIDTEILNKKYKDTNEVKEDVQNEIDSMVEQYGNGDMNSLLQQTYSAWGIDTEAKLRDYLKDQQTGGLEPSEYFASFLIKNLFNIDVYPNTKEEYITQLLFLLDHLF